MFFFSSFFFITNNESNHQLSLLSEATASAQVESINGDVLTSDFVCFFLRSASHLMSKGQSFFDLPRLLVIRNYDGYRRELQVVKLVV